MLGSSFALEFSFSVEQWGLLRVGKCSESNGKEIRKMVALEIGRKLSYSPRDYTLNGHGHAKPSCPPCLAYCRGWNELEKYNFLFYFAFSGHILWLKLWAQPLTIWAYVMPMYFLCFGMNIRVVLITKTLGFIEYLIFFEYVVTLGIVNEYTNTEYLLWFSVFVCIRLFETLDFNIRPPNSIYVFQPFSLILEGFFWNLRHPYNEYS